MKTLTTKNVAGSVAEMIGVEDMIAALKELPAGSKLCVRQEGFYALGKFADINLPEAITVTDEVTKEQVVVYSIGNSDQNY